jgi:hypothetical protein
MTINEIEIPVLNPRGEIKKIPRFPAAQRLDSLAGKKIGVLKFSGNWGLTEELLPLAQEILRDRAKGIQFREWSMAGGSTSREDRLKEVVDYADGVIVMLAFTGTSSARTALEAVEIEKLGVPVAFAITRPFEANARFVASREGLPDISIVAVPLESLPHPGEIAELKLPEKFADDVIEALTRTPSIKTEQPEREILPFKGPGYAGAADAMNTYFLRKGWSDGLPLMPPTREAVDEMLRGTELPPDHVVGLIEPAGGEATIEKIAVNAVMAGCRPAYMPVLIAAVEAITDPRFDLREVQCTSCNMSPFLIVSGPQLIDDLNINDSFSTIGPGWRANSTIGRAVRLIMTNLGHTWPGVNDMKTLGSPFRFVPLMAENEAAYQGAWEPLRVAEGFSEDQATVSVMPAMSWQADIVQPEPPTAKMIINYIARQGKVKHDRLAANWGMDNLVLLCASTFDCIRREGYSRASFQQALVDAIQIPVADFLHARKLEDLVAFGRLPDWLIEKCRGGADALVPILAGPESIKLCVSGGAGPYGITYTSTFGYGAARFVTKPIQLPSNWDSLVTENKEWQSPLIK